MHHQWRRLLKQAQLEMNERDAQREDQGEELNGGDALPLPGDFPDNDVPVDGDAVVFFDISGGLDEQPQVHVISALPAHSTPTQCDPHSPMHSVCSRFRSGWTECVLHAL